MDALKKHPDCEAVYCGTQECDGILPCYRRNPLYERYSVGKEDPRKPIPETKDTNPKDAIGSGKLPMHLIPASALAHLSLAFLEGALKYGKYNWRVAGVRASIYLDAIDRHKKKFQDGQDCDVETRVHHLASVMACCAIMLDAINCGKLTDDRPPSAPTPELIDAMADNVAHLKQLFAGHNPHQHTITDSEG